MSERDWADKAVETMHTYGLSALTDRERAAIIRKHAPPQPDVGLTVEQAEEVQSIMTVLTYRQQRIYDDLDRLVEAAKEAKKRE